MLDHVMCIGNDGTFERGRFPDGVPFTIDVITLKMASGKRFRRYAVCVAGCWKTGEYMPLRDARQKVEELRELHKPFKPFSVDRVREFAKEHGARSARDLLLLGGYSFLEGSCRDYDELMKELERMTKE